MRIDRFMCLLVVGVGMFIVTGCNKKEVDEVEGQIKKVKVSSVPNKRAVSPAIGKHLSVFNNPNPAPETISEVTRALEALDTGQLRDSLLKLEPYDTRESKILADHILRAISVKDPKLALDLSLGLPQDVRMLSACYTLMARRNPDVVFDWLSENKSSDSFQLMNACLGSVSELCQVNPEKTVAVFSSLEPKVKSFMLPVLMRSLASQDAKAAVALASKYFGGVDLDRAYVSILGKVAESDPQQAVQMLEGVPESSKAQCIKGMLPTLLQDGTVDVSAILSAAAKKELPSLLAEGGCVERLVKLDADKAMSLMDSVPLTEQNRQLYVRFAMSIAERDSAKAIEYLKTLPVGGASKEIAGKMFEKFAQSNPGDAVEQVSSLPAEYQASANRGVARALAKVDSDEAFKMADRVAPAQRQDVYREIARQVTYSNPQDAVRLLEDPKLSGVIGQQFRSEMLDHTVRGWAKSDLVEARTWVEKLPATDMPMGVQGLMNPWMKSDPVAASEWLSALPPGAARDAGARVVIEQVKNTDPEMAEQWRKSLSQPAGGQK